MSTANLRSAPVANLTAWAIDRAHRRYGLTQYNAQVWDRGAWGVGPGAWDLGCGTVGRGTWGVWASAAACAWHPPWT